MEPETVEENSPSGSYHVSEYNRYANYNTPSREVMVVYSAEDPGYMDTGDSVQNKPLPEDRILMEKGKFDGLVKQCLETCIRNIISNGQSRIPHNKRNRDSYLRLFVLNASENTFFGNVIFIDVLVPILINFENIANRNRAIDIVLSGYNTSVFEEASHYLKTNINNFKQMARETCILILIRMLVDRFYGEFTNFGKKSASVKSKSVKKDLIYLKQL